MRAIKELCMLTNRSHGTLMSYTDRFKSNTPNEQHDRITTWQEHMTESHETGNHMT